MKTDRWYGTTYIQSLIDIQINLLIFDVDIAYINKFDLTFYDAIIQQTNYYYLWKNVFSVTILHSIPSINITTSTSEFCDFRTMFCLYECLVICSLA